MRSQPSLTNFIRPVDYADYVETYANKSAETHYQKGLALLNVNNKTAFREAYNEFKNALRYTPDDNVIQKNRKKRIRRQSLM